MRWRGRFGKTKQNQKKKPTIATLTKAVHRLSGQKEVKYLDLANGAATSTYVGNVACLSAIVQGTQDFGQRIGDTTTLRSVHIKGTVLGDGAATGYINQQRLRLIVFRGIKENGVFPSAGDILATTYLSGSNAINAPRSFDTSSSWKVYFDRIYTVGAGFNYPTTGLYQSGIPTEKEFNIFIPLHNAKLQQIAATTQIAAGGVYILAVGETSANVNYKFNSRLKYTDS